MPARRTRLQSCLLGAATVCVVLLWAGRAHAQSPIGMATQVQGEGFRISEQGRLHVGGNVDFRFDSNPVYLPANAVGDLALRITAIADLTLPSERLELMLNLAGGWQQYLGIINVATRELSAFSGTFSGGMLVNKSGFMTFFLNETLTRAQLPANAAINQRLSTLRNSVRAGTDIKPGGGALEFRVSCGFDFIYYDANQISVQEPASLSYYTVNPALRAMWRFFPKTALTLEVDGAITRYPFESTQVVNVGMNALRAQAGLLGVITDKLTITARAGYSNSFLVRPSGSSANAAANLRDYSSAIGTLQIVWRPTQLATITVGYAQDYTPVSIYTWSSFYRPFVEYQQLFFNRFILNLRAQYAYQAFGPPIVPGLATDRHDSVLLGEVRFTYHVFPWFAGSVYYMPDLRFTTFVSPNGVSGQYLRHVVGLDVTMAY